MKILRKNNSLMQTLVNVALFQLALFAPLWAQATPLPLFGPERFTRAAGAPDTSSRIFAAHNTDATYCLVVENGAAGKDRVSSATIFLNGEEVVRSSDLNQRVEKVEKEVHLLGNNTLAVRLASNSGGFLTVNLVCVAAFPTDLT